MQILAAVVCVSPHTWNQSAIIHETDSNWCFQASLVKIDQDKSRSFLDLLLKTQKMASLKWRWNLLDPSHHFYHCCLQMRPTAVLANPLWRIPPFSYLFSTNVYEAAFAIYCLRQWNIQQRGPNISLGSRWKPNMFKEGPSADECQTRSEIFLLRCLF